MTRQQLANNYSTDSFDHLIQALTINTLKI